MPVARVNGVRIHYREEGQGYPLVLVHGGGVSSEMWTPQVEHFVRRYRVITYDCRGFGGSEAPSVAEAYSQSAFVEDLRQLLGHLGIERACVCGLSMGGGIALSFGLTYPDLVDGLVICDTGSGSDDPEAWRRGCFDLASLLETQGMDAFAETLLRAEAHAYYVAQGPHAADHLRLLIVNNPPHGVAGTLRGVMAVRAPLYALEEQLRSVTAPVLVVVGEHDRACRGVSEFLARTLPRAELCVLAGTGHVTNLEDAAGFNAAVERFLSSLWGGPT